MGVDSKQREEYLAYRAEVASEVLPAQVRVAAWVVFAVNVPFSVLDQLAFAGQLDDFWVVRLALSVACVGIASALARRFPLQAAWFLAAATGGMLVSVLYWTGSAPTTEYYAGLVLFLCGLSVLLPFRSWEAGILCAAINGAFLLSPWVTGYSPEWAVFGVHAIFLLSASLVCVASCYALEQVKFRAFQNRREVESARDDLKALDSAKSRFTANIHHELRTPLTLMLAPIEAMRSGDLGEVPAGLDRTLRTMQSNGLRLLKLINNLLDLAKIESEQLSIRRIPTNLERLVREVADGAAAMSDRKGLWLRVEGFEGLGAFCLDPDALEKVLVNLIGNALKFTDEGGITVRASAVAPGKEGLGPKGGVHLTVEDTGMGIPRDQLGRVFDRFAQVDGSSTRKHEGTGIGLSLVHELVELHGGRVWATSEGAGQGSQMHVLLPVGEPDDEPEEDVLLAGDGERALSAAKSFKALASEVSMDLEEHGDARFAAVEHSVSRWEASQHGDDWLAELPELPPGTPEVVIAEDNAEMRRLVAFLVGKEFVVRPTRNGREALETVRARPPQLVITDVMMPEMSGTELCRAIKSDPALAAVPVMLVTSKAEREMKIEGLELGADDYVTKPFHPRELMARARSLVRIRSLQEALAGQNEELAQSNRDLARALDDLKEAEVQLVQAERLAAVGELSAGVAHEVNNPLNFARNSLATLKAYVDDLQGLAALIGGLDASDPARLRVQLVQLERKKQELRFEDLASDLAELVGIVTEGLDRTARLVADLRDFAAPPREGTALVDVAAALRSTLQLLGHRLREAGARVTLDLGEDLVAIPGDAGGLNQVFLNLLKNAAEAIEGQNRTIAVQARMCGEVLEVRVQDSGPGVDPEVRERLFEPFFTTKEAGQGTGLGLAMCRRIVAEHGGSIEVQSAPGEGACAVVRLPVRGAEEPGS